MRWRLLVQKLWANAIFRRDVVYFDAGDPQRYWRRFLEEEAPDFVWDITNQATVHHWQRIVLGQAAHTYL